VRHHAESLSWVVDQSKASSPLYIIKVEKTFPFEPKMFNLNDRRMMASLIRIKCSNCSNVAVTHEVANNVLIRHQKH